MALHITAVTTWTKVAAAEAVTFIIKTLFSLYPLFPKCCCLHFTELWWVWESSLKRRHTLKIQLKNFAFHRGLKFLRSSKMQPNAHFRILNAPVNFFLAIKVCPNFLQHAYLFRRFFSLVRRSDAFGRKCRTFIAGPNIFGAFFPVKQSLAVISVLFRHQFMIENTLWWPKRFESIIWKLV